MKQRKSLFQAVVSVLVASFLMVQPVLAISAEQWSRYANNSILFYDPDGDCVTRNLDGTAAPDSNQITWIGDSISFYSADTIKDVFPSVDLQAEVGKFFATDQQSGNGGASGLNILANLVNSGNLREYLVFALVTNDELYQVGYNGATNTSITIDYLNKLAELAGPDTKVVLMTGQVLAPMYQGVFNNANDLIRKFVASHDNFYLADWEAVARAQLNNNDFWMDSVHPSETTGAAAFVSVIESALKEATGTTVLDCNVDCYYSSGGLLSGDSRIEKIWNYMVNLNISGFSDNPAAISGVIANMWTETGGTFNPFIQNPGGCTGIIQWCPGSWNNGFFSTMESKGLSQYYYHGSEPNMDEATINSGLQAQLDFLFANGVGGVTAANFMDNIGVPSSKNGVSGAKAYAELFLVTVENAFETSNTAGQTIEDTGVKALATSRGHERWQGAAARREHAETIYNTYANAGASANDTTITGGGTATTGTGVTWTDGWIDGGTLPGYTKEVPASGWSDETENRAFKTADGKPNKILLHSTEGQQGGISAYPTGNHFAAHFTLDAVNQKISQHYSINVASNSIKTYDTSGPIQIEIVGFSQGHEGNKYRLYDFTEEQWDYIALVLTAISENTGIPLTTSVNWENPARISADAFMTYSGILGHMHAPGNDHVDPGNIWGYLSAAFSRNPSSNRFMTNAGTTICTEAGGENSASTLPEGGFTSVEEADAAIMAKYRAVTPRKYGETAEGDEYLAAHGINNVKCESGGITSAMENCVGFSGWFVSEYTDTTLVSTGGNNHGYLPDGKNVAERLIEGYGFQDMGNTITVFGVFSVTTSSEFGHTGVILGINPNNGKIITGEAGCGSALASSKAREKDPSYFANARIAYKPTSLSTGTNTTNVSISTEDVTIKVPGASGSSKVAWVSDLHMVNSEDLSAYPGLQERYNANVDGVILTDKDGNVIHNEDVWMPIIDYINNNNFDAAIFGGDIMDYYSKANADLVNEGLSKLKVPYIYIRADHDYEFKHSGMSEDETHNAHKSVGNGDNTCKTLNLSGVKIVGWNYSVKGFDNPYNAGLYDCINSNLGKTTIIATHVPIASNVDNSKLNEYSANKGHSDPYYWASNGGTWSFYGQVQELANKIYNGEAVYVLAGHMHPNLNGKSGFTVKLSDNASEHVFKAAYIGSVGVINIVP